MSKAPSARNREFETSLGFSIAQQILVLVGAAGAHALGLIWLTVAGAAAIYWIGTAIIVVAWGRYAPRLGYIFLWWGFLIAWVAILVGTLWMQ